VLELFGQDWSDEDCRVGAHLHRGQRRDVDGATGPIGQLTNDREMWGALFAKQINSSGKVRVHDDEGILKILGCQGGDESRKDCGDCVNPNPACGADGTCGSCTKDQACCPLLICDALGECSPRPPEVESIDRSRPQQVLFRQTLRASIRQTSRP
jgi:hypothetical protein